jgi:replicative DNA helicase
LSAVPIEGPAGAGRSLPHNIEAEQALLGAILINNEALAKVVEFLRPEHFYEPVHGRIYAVIEKLVERGQIANPVTLKTYFEHDEALAEIGGAPYLARLTGSATTIINAAHYGRVVHDLALRRSLITLGEEVVLTAYDSRYDLPAGAQIERAEQKLFRLAEEGQPEGGFRTLESSLASAVTLMEAAYKRESGLTGVATGFRDLDEMLGGLHPSDLVILAGRPSMGKTALATNIAFSAAKAFREERDELGQSQVTGGSKVGFFSLEMSAEQLATRILAEESRIDSDRLRRGKLSREEFLKVVEASRRIEEAPLFIDDTPALSIGQLRTRARRLKRQQGLSLVVVDYLQLIRPSSEQRSDNRVQEVAEVTQGLKALAKELNLPVLALSQLSRAVEQRDDKRPQLADLRESGAIEQDADVVMFIFREEYYLRRREPAQDSDKHAEWKARMDSVYNVAEIIVAKQRHGPIGTKRLYFEHTTTKFGDLDRHHGSDGPY